MSQRMKSERQSLQEDAMQDVDTFDIAAFMAPGTQPRASQPTRSQSSSSSSATDDDAASNHTGSESAARRSSLHLTAKRDPDAESEPGSKSNAKSKAKSKKRTHEQKEEDEDDEDDDDDDDIDAEAERPTPRKKKHKKKASTSKLQYIARHGLINSSLPLLIALTRERVLEYSYPAAAQALEKLYPAYRLDMDTVFKMSVEVLEKHQQMKEQIDGGGSQQQFSSQNDSSQQQQQQTNNQLTRFYRKILNLQPKNLIQVVIELANLFLSTGAVQDCFDHLTTWSQSHYFTPSGSSGVQERNTSAMRYLHGLLGVCAWACAADAKEQVKKCEEMIQKRQQDAEMGAEESDMDDSSEPQHHRFRFQTQRSSHQHHRQSISDLTNELRTAQQKRLSFEKLARAKLKNAVDQEPGNGIWLVHYLECTCQFYAQALPIELEKILPPNTTVPTQAVISAAQTRLLDNRKKLLQLQSRLMRKIDEFIVAAPPGPSGFHMKLYYLDVFQSTRQARTTQDRIIVWCTLRHLLEYDPVNNDALLKAWSMWCAQEEVEQPPLLSDANELNNNGWCVRIVDMIEIIASRLDIYPSELWSWSVLARLLATLLRINSAVNDWPIPGSAMNDEVDEIASAAAGSNALVATPMMQGESGNALVRSDSEQSSASSVTSSRRKKLVFPDPITLDPATPSSSAASTPLVTPAGAAASSKSMPPLRVDSDASSSESSKAGGGRHASSSSSASNDSLLSDSSKKSVRTFSHESLDSLPQLTAADRRNRWLGRIEWWVQANGWWKDVKQLKPSQAPIQLPDETNTRSLILRGVCFSMVLQWILVK